jgi:hypothetical protein
MMVCEKMLEDESILKCLQNMLDLNNAAEANEKKYSQETIDNVIGALWQLQQANRKRPQSYLSCLHLKDDKVTSLSQPSPSTFGGKRNFNALLENAVVKNSIQSSSEQERDHKNDPAVPNEQFVYIRNDSGTTEYVTEDESDQFNSKQGHIMLSYQWDDQSFVKKVKSSLKASGFKVWMDVDQMAGSTLAAMAHAVENAAVVVIFLCRKYRMSPNCRSEAEYAYACRKPIVPVKTQSNYRPEGWLGILVGTKLWFDFSFCNDSVSTDAAFVDAVRQTMFHSKMISLKKELRLYIGYDVVINRKPKKKLKSDGGRKKVLCDDGSNPPLKKIKPPENEEISVSKDEKSLEIDSEKNYHTIVYSSGEGSTNGYLMNSTEFGSTFIKSNSLSEETENGNGDLRTTNMHIDLNVLETSSNVLTRENDLIVRSAASHDNIVDESSEHDYSYRKPSTSPSEERPPLSSRKVMNDSLSLARVSQLNSPRCSSSNLPIKSVSSSRSLSIDNVYDFILEVTESVNTAEAFRLQLIDGNALFELKNLATANDVALLKLLKDDIGITSLGIRLKILGALRTFV